MRIKANAKWFLFLVLCLCFSPLSLAVAQDDIENSKDHFLVSRMPNFEIVAYEDNFNEFEVPLPNEKLQKMEGHLTYINYQIIGEAKAPSELQIIRNYTNALTRMGGKIIFDGEHGEIGGGRTATIKLMKDNREFWIVLNAFNCGAGYWLRVLEIKKMVQDVAQGSMEDTLRVKGRVTVKINFDSGKAEIQASSDKTLDDITQMMAKDPSLKLRIEGHTDNVGKAWDNLKLSLARAQNVAFALIKRGIQAERLAASGFGQALPLADNSTDEGKAKNRRVELVRL